MTRRIILILALQTGFITARQTKLDSLVKAGINQIYSINFAEAEKTFSVVKESFPNHPAGYFFKAMVVWWKILLDINNTEYDDEFYDRLGETIDFCDDILDVSPENTEALFFKGGALGFRGRLSAIREDFFDAALDGKEALPLVYQVYEIDSTNVDVQLGFGIYNYYAEVIPEEYPFVKPFMVFFPGGNRQLGLRQLKRTAEFGKYAKIESQYFVMQLYYQYEKDYHTAEKYALLLTRQFPNNPIFERYLGRIEIKLSGYIHSVNIWKSIYEKCKTNLPGYNKQRLRESSYYIGMDYFSRGKFDSAMTYFEESRALSKILDAEKESGWLVNSTLFLGNIYDKLNYRDGAVELYKEVLEMDEYSDSHKKAEKYLKKKYQ